MISDLPMDLAEKVLSNLLVTSLGPVRSTCKKWNELSRFDGSPTKKLIGEANAAAKSIERKEFQVVMMLDYRVYLFSVDLHYPSSIERVGKLVRNDDADRVVGDISKVFHCDGLLLCLVTKDTSSSLVVWNPCSGQTRWIEPRNSYHRFDTYALGYELNNHHEEDSRSHKILRSIDTYDYTVKHSIREFEIYNLNSNSWKVVDDDVNPNYWDVHYYHRGVSLKGNTYWYAQEKPPMDAPPVISDTPDFLLCFDFTAERFVPRLPLPFHGFDGDTVALSSVRETQLAVLFQKFGLPMQTVGIWITTKIEPNAVSWSIFLTVDMMMMKPPTGFQFNFTGCSFFVDEKKKVAVVLDKNRRSMSRPTRRNIAYIIYGDKGYLEQVDLGESRNGSCRPLVCSYVPSSVQINQPAP